MYPGNPTSWMHTTSFGTCTRKLQCAMYSYINLSSCLPSLFNNNIFVFSVQGLFHLPYNVLTVLWNLCQGNEISTHFDIKKTVWFFFNSKWCMVWWWPEQKAETSNHCELLMVFMYDDMFNKHLDVLAQRGCVKKKTIISPVVLYKCKSCSH